MILDFDDMVRLSLDRINLSKSAFDMARQHEQQAEVSPNKQEEAYRKSSDRLKEKTVEYIDEAVQRLLTAKDLVLKNNYSFEVNYDGNTK